MKLRTVIVSRRTPLVRGLPAYPFGHYLERLYHGEALRTGRYNQPGRSQLPVSERIEYHFRRSGAFIPEVFEDGGWFFSVGALAEIESVCDIATLPIHYDLLYDLPFPTKPSEVLWSIDEQAVSEFFDSLPHSPRFDKKRLAQNHRELLVPIVSEELEEFLIGFGDPSTPIGREWIEQKVTTDLFADCPIVESFIGLMFVEDVFQRVKRYFEPQFWNITELNIRRK